MIPLSPPNAASNAATSSDSPGMIPTAVPVLMSSAPAEARNQVSTAGFESERPFHNPRSTFFDKRFSASEDC